MGSERRNVGGGGGLEVPAAERKLVHTVREVLNKNSTDSEIYSVLRDCNMDPNEAVQRLLSQDTFQEVKSKRERRKEMKEMQDSRPRGHHNGSLGVRVGGEHDVRCGGTSPLSYNEDNEAAYKYKGEDETVDPSLSSFSTSETTFTGKSTNEQSLPLSYSFNADNRRQSIETGVTVSSSGQRSPGLQPAWLRAATDHMSMADIVRMGGLKVKSSEMLTPLDAVAPYLSDDSTKLPVSAPMLSELHRDLHSQHSSNVKEVIHECINAGRQNFYNEWNLSGLRDATDGMSELDAYDGLEPNTCSKQSYGHNKRANWSDNWHSDEVPVPKGDVAADNVNIDCSVSSASSQAITTSCDGSLKGIGFYDSHTCMFEQQEALSSDTANEHCVNLEKEQTRPPKEDGNSVVLPHYLREQVADCSHLSFGTYKPGNAANFGLLASNHLKNDVAEASASVYGSSAGHGDRRSLGYTGEQLGSMHDAKNAMAHARNYDGPLSSQPEGSKLNISGQLHENEYISLSSICDSKFNNIQHLSSALSFVTDPNARNHSLHPSEEHAYTTSVPLDFLATNVQSSRDFDHLHSPFFAPTESARYNSALSSLSSQSIAISEVLNSGTFATPHSSSQSMSGTSRIMRPILPQQLSAYSYSQPSHPSAELENLVGYSAMRQNNTYMPHATQQVYPDGNALYDSLSDLRDSLPQYESGASRSNLLPSNAGASGYGGFRRGSLAPGSFRHSLPPTGPIGTGVGYDDVLHSQYKERSNLMMLQQSGSSSAWDYAPGSRMMPNDLESRYSSFMGQNQQLSAYQQGQQSSESYGGSAGYLNLCPSQTEIAQEQKLQKLRDFILHGNQEPSSQEVGQFLQRKH
ncbi:hypothetical protein HS088_TW17G00018 [Tripterygium wilfordii]|uniref:GBF-interacting protein 1 N-terminal domain-containing protein n=1 Tax=Tripterygium wilfordii TaxID=458696 RepID=A0A7J7CEA7_TRIWF|nr:uncharacterized protein LOC119982388 [Tripterygium wilfordii]KAF5732491.1 hypothetical protein HS088_TW17G00018 [Tripterygium wilfordii]